MKINGSGILTILGGIIHGAVDRAIRQDLKVSVLYVHPDFPGGAGDMGQVG